MPERSASWTESFNAAMREAGLDLGSIIFFITGGDHWLNDYPFVGGSALNNLFLGARGIFHDNGNAYQEPLQLLNAEYCWSTRSTGYAPQPRDYQEAWQSLDPSRRKQRQAPGDLRRGRPPAAGLRSPVRPRRSCRDGPLLQRIAQPSRGGRKQRRPRHPPGRRAAAPLLPPHVAQQDPRRARPLAVPGPGLQDLGRPDRQRAHAHRNGPLEDRSPGAPPATEPPLDRYAGDVRDRPGPAERSPRGCCLGGSPPGTPVPARCHPYQALR